MNSSDRMPPVKSPVEKILATKYSTFNCKWDDTKMEVTGNDSSLTMKWSAKLTDRAGVADAEEHSVRRFS